MWKNIHMENNPSFQDSLAVEHPEPSSSHSYLPVYIAVFFLIVVLIVVTGVLMNRPDFVKSNSNVMLVPNNDLSALCATYASTYPLKDGFGVYSSGLVTVGQDTYCELVVVGMLVTVDENKFELSYPGKLQTIRVAYDASLEISPANNINTFPNDFYDLTVYEKLQRFKDVTLGVTIKVNEDASFSAKEVSVGGRILNDREIEALETSEALLP